MSRRFLRAFLTVAVLLFLAGGSRPSYADTQKRSDGKSSSSTKSGEKAKSSEKKEKKSDKTVHVKEYTRKDGTKVKAHDRHPPGSANESAGGSSTTTASSTTASAAHTPSKSGTTRSDRCDNCDRDENGRIARSGKAKKQFQNATG
jgi:hypothetical protein